MPLTGAVAYPSMAPPAAVAIARCAEVLGARELEARAMNFTDGRQAARFVFQLQNQLDCWILATVAVSFNAAVEDTITPRLFNNVFAKSPSLAITIIPEDPT